MPDGVVDEGSFSMMAVLEDLGKRFAGVDITFRRFAPSEWEGCWRVRMVTNKNERDEYRITKYGQTFEDAALRLIDNVRELDDRYR